MQSSAGTTNARDDTLKLPCIPGHQAAPCCCGCNIPLRFSRRYGRLLVAANLRDSEALMPHLILQLAALLAHCPPRTVLLSVYESGSRDATGGNACDALCFPLFPQFLGTQVRRLSWTRASFEHCKGSHLADVTAPCELAMAYMGVVMMVHD